MDQIAFHREDIACMPENLNLIKPWIIQIITEHTRKPGDINIIFCSDEYLFEINRQYLNHDDYTDIITFDTADDKDTIAGDIFISIERITENASIFGNEFENELNRVIIHGILHLLGYSDKTEANKTDMTKMEDACLEKLTNLNVPRGT